MKAEAPSILRWAVEGCLAWQQNGLEPPEAVRHATEEYRHDQDLVAQFLDECCVIGPTHRVRSTELYEAYHRWSERGGLRALSQKSLAPKLAERFEKCEDRNGRAEWSGVMLLNGSAGTTL